MTHLEIKLGNIRAGRYTRADFIIADAKDGDMGSGVTATGFIGAGAGQRRRTRAEFLDQIQAIVEQGVVDIMLTSVSNLEQLNQRGVYAGSKVKPAFRANDTTDCWGGVRHARYAKHPSQSFRSAHLARAVYGTPTPVPGQVVTGTDLCLYSVTFLNDVAADTAALEEFARFRDEAAALLGLASRLADDDATRERVMLLQVQLATK